MRLAPTTSALIVVLLVAGCSPGETKTASVAAAKISSRAANEAAAAFGRSSKTLELSGGDISRLATEAGVSQDAIQLMAPQTDIQPLWRRSLEAAQNVNEKTQGPTRDVAIGAACDAVNGKISTIDDLYISLAGQLRDLSQPELESIKEATAALWQDLRNAKTSDNSDQRTEAALFCFTVQAMSSSGG